ncbi:MAG: TrkH family potassium uptake protein [Alphaproteobacteria bacterium]|nr:TrkH family potassium uptake protein [Alphaproteobacteria bacterium]
MAAMMIIPLVADLYIGHGDWKIFFLCMLLTFFFSGILILTNRGSEMKISPRQGFVMINLAWLLLSLFGALPFWLSGLNIRFVDAFFESVSGITTTGSTVFTGLDDMPRGILLWRSLLQWLGGVGVILMAMSIMPFLKIGGMQMFQTELSESEKALPRTTQLASSIGIIYLILTLLCFVAYDLAGFAPFDALCHALTTISTGGFSTHDSSFSGHDNVRIELVAILFMIAGGTPFVLFLKAARGNWRPFLRDSQFRWFLSIVLAATFLLTIYLVLTTPMPLDRVLLKSTFNIVSLLTGTGFTSDNYGLWGGFAVFAFFFIMVIGACAGSTSCGIKIFRFQVLYAVANAQVRKLIQPHGVFIPYYNGKPIPEGVPISVMSFFFLFAVCFSILALLLALTGLDFLTAMSGAATAIANVGPGLGEIIGPVGTFQPLPDSAKWVLCAGMLLGRLEIFTLLVMLSPHFWRR